MRSTALIETHCASVADDEWDLDGLAKELASSGRPRSTSAKLAACGDTDEMYDLVMADATAHYEQREVELGADVMREVERQVMLRIIDQRWREHLEEMDYLKEGINLRAMGQKDPLTEWQREGYEMFGAMMKGDRPGLRALRDARPGRPERRRSTAEGAEHPADVERDARTRPGSTVLARPAVAEGDMPPGAAARATGR